MAQKVGATPGLPPIADPAATAAAAPVARRTRRTASAATETGQAIARAARKSPAKPAAVAAAGVGAGLLGGLKLGVDRRILIAGAAVAGVALLGAVGWAFLSSRTKDVPVVTTVETGHPSQDSAVLAASQNGADRVIVEAGGDYQIMSVPPESDFDNTDPSKIRIVGATAKALVTRDGNLLLPLATGQGFRIASSILNPDQAIDAARLDASDVNSVRRLENLKIGTDGKHNEIRIGALTGATQGYASPLRAARDAHYGHASARHHAIIEIGTKSFLFTLDVPPGMDFGSSSVRMRGSQLTSPGVLTIQQGDRAFFGRGPAEPFVKAEGADSAWEPGVAFPKAASYTVTLSSVPDFSEAEALPPRSEERKLKVDEILRNHFATEGKAVLDKLRTMSEEDIVLHAEANLGSNSFSVKVASQHAEAFDTAMSAVDGVGDVAPSEL